MHSIRFTFIKIWWQQIAPPISALAIHFWLISWWFSLAVVPIALMSYISLYHCLLHVVRSSCLPLQRLYSSVSFSKFFPYSRWFPLLSLLPWTGIPNYPANTIHRSIIMLLLCNCNAKYPSANSSRQIGVMQLLIEDEYKQVYYKCCNRCHLNRKTVKLIDAFLSVVCFCQSNN